VCPKPNAGPERIASEEFKNYGKTSAAESAEEDLP
jgi:hypothetical protein